jgi:hypothetical protein
MRFGKRIRELLETSNDVVFRGSQGHRITWHSRIGADAPRSVRSIFGEVVSADNSAPTKTRATRLSR